jgi:AraC family transcriptional regulator, regulatory protein of adaptative response / methylated-DNA-[protein]-cysteine methyltransferase
MKTNLEQAWQAVAARDSRFDGRFVFAVSSTGIYCRPSCPSRRPRRERVAFYPDAGAAEKEGYRPCRRCRPKSALPPPAVQRVELAREYLEARGGERVTLERLGRAVRMSPHHLQRSFKKLVGVTPREYAESLRLRGFKRRVKKGDDVTTAMYESGFGSSSRLYEKSDQRLGMTPAAYRRGGKGMQIRYAVVPSPLGRLLVAATDRGVCAVAFGQDDARLEADLRAEYPAASLEKDAGEFRGWIAAISRFLAGEGELLSLPIDVRGTAFQHRVWKALRDIPAGQTRSYGEVAASIGKPKASRAVARACATNRAAVVVPCHRVVRGDGGLGGYRWGPERKRRLLKLEGAEPAGSRSL